MPDVRFEIDGIPVEAATGDTVLRAADRAGIFIPRYCYHPALSIAGSCRICQVEIEGRRDPVISCNEPVADGMVVRTDTPAVKRVRRAVMEFLLLNHPIDCPICDTAGECDLQNFYMTEGRHRSRLEHPKVNARKAKRIGGKVVLDQERCILCSRCVRFTAEITKTGELGIFGRGSTEVVDIVEGRPLETGYAGCVVDLCPVGALTDDDFRFKCRVWYLEEERSICPGCAAGCNITIHFNVARPWKAGGARIMRLKPRENPDVNGWWMCDEGRYGYGFVDAGDRIREPAVRDGDGWSETTWDGALGVVAAACGSNGAPLDPGRAVLMPSPWMSNEAAFVLRVLFRDAGGVRSIGLLRGGGPAGGDGFLRRDDRAPNRRGVETILLDPGEAGEAPGTVLGRAVRDGCGLLLIFCGGGEEPEEEALLARAIERAECAVVLASNRRAFMEAARVILPVATFAEVDGTFTNGGGRVQRFRRAFGPPGGAMADRKAVVALGRRVFGTTPQFGSAAAVFDALARSNPAFRGLDYAALGDRGRPLAGADGGREARKTEATR